jgi:hemerythrin-like domain-containing protein
MSPLLERLALDHRRLSQLLRLLEGLLNQINEGTEPDYATMSELVDYMIDYADQVHHRSEDLIFERLMEQEGCGNAVLSQLMQQHQSLSQMSRRFRDSLDSIVHGEVVRRDEVELQGRSLVDALREHMRLEDERAFPLAEACFSEETWAALLEAAPQIKDPVFGQSDPERFRAIYKQLHLEGEP